MSTYESPECHHSDTWSYAFAAFGLIFVTGAILLSIWIFYCLCHKASTVQTFFQWFAGITAVLLTMTSIQEWLIMILCDFINYNDTLLLVLKNSTLSTFLLSQLSLFSLLLGRLYYTMINTSYNYAKCVYITFSIILFINGLLIVVNWITFILFDFYKSPQLTGSVLGVLTMSIMIENVVLLILFVKTIVKVES